LVIGSSLPPASKSTEAHGEIVTPACVPLEVPAREDPSLVALGEKSRPPSSSFRTGEKWNRSDRLGQDSLRLERQENQPKGSGSNGSVYRFPGSPFKSFGGKGDNAGKLAKWIVSKTASGVSDGCSSQRSSSSLTRLSSAIALTPPNALLISTV
jgi:hypothetical protein